MYSLHSILILILLNAFTNDVIAQAMTPEISNYAFGSSQNWSIDVDEEGVVYTANHSGLSRYNGQFWTIHQLPKKMVVRSVLCVDQKIYTGSYEEFGYWQMSELGELQYTSLRSKFEGDGPLQSEEFWQIIKFGNDIIFRSFGGIYLYNGKTIRRIVEDYNVSRLSVYKDRLIFSSLSDGLMEIRNNDVIPFFPDYEFIKSVKLIATHENLLIFYEEESGGYFYQNGALSQLPQSLQDLLKKYDLNTIEFVDNNKVIFGTVKNGVIVYNLNEHSYYILNKQSGINNNTVLETAAIGNNLWLALDNGISKISLNNHIKYFLDASGTLGTVYDAVFLNNRYYLATNTGIYRYYQDNIELIEGSEGHCWGFFRYGDKLFCGHNDGALLLTDDTLLPIEGSFSGVYSYTSIPNSDNFLVSTYSGLGLMSNKAGNFSISKLDGIDLPIDKVVFNGNETLLASGNYSDLFKINANYSSSNFTTIEHVERISNKFNGKVNIELINNKPHFNSGSKWFFINQSEKFEQLKTLDGLKLLANRNDDIWFWDTNSSFIQKFNNEFDLLKQITLNDNLVSKFLDGHEKIRFKNDNTIILNLIDGFATLELDKITQKNEVLPKIDRIYINEKLVKLPVDGHIQLSHNQARRVSFEVFIPKTYDRNLKYLLTGEQNQVEDIQNGKFSLQNLPAGTYSLNIYDEFTPELSKTLTFEISPQWYYNIWMKLIYMLIIIIAIFLAGYFQKKKAHRAHVNEQNRLKQKAIKEIQLLERKNLMKEIQHKKKELTNSTAYVVQKNETIIFLRNELKRLEETSPNKVRTKNVLRKSGEQLDSNNDWALFESQFKELNEDFFKKLSAAYPKLTTKNRKLCAYIKVGLTSKEIAPLLGITKRSVELQRYRLRKKLNLSNDISFDEFLDNF
jgi:DNA-binding CsgD family transcriptional regulator/uncharacterized protein YneF (UPF0154 family)